MNSDIQCPRCHSRDIIDYGETIYCPRCDLDFEKSSFGIIDEGNILSNQELKAFRKAFELDNEEVQKRIFEEEDEEDEEDGLHL